jgi:hypothetical protein
MPRTSCGPTAGENLLATSETRSQDARLSAGKWYRINVEYTQADDQPRPFALLWSIDGAPAAPVPGRRLFPLVKRAEIRLPSVAPEDLERAWLQVINSLQGDDRTRYQALTVAQLGAVKVQALRQAAHLRDQLIDTASHRVVLSYRHGVFQPSGKPPADDDRFAFALTRGLQHTGSYSDGAATRAVSIKQWVSGPMSNPRYRWLFAVDGEAVIDLTTRPSAFPRPAWPPTFEPDNSDLLSPRRSNVAANTLFLVYRNALKEQRRLGKWHISAVVERDLRLEGRHESDIMQEEWYLDRLVIHLTRRVSTTELEGLVHRARQPAGTSPETRSQVGDDGR